MTILEITSLALRIAVIIGFAAIINTIKVRASAGSRHWVWMIALGGTVLIPLAQRSVPPVRILPWTPASAAIHETPTAVEAVTDVKNATSSPVVVNDVPGASQQAELGQKFSITPELGIVLLWVAGALFLLLRLVRAHLIARGVVVRARRWSDSEIASVPIKGSTEIDLPFTYGLRSPVIVFPEAASGWSAERFKATLIHEQEHAERRDGISLLISQCVRSLYWWHPLVWYATRAAAAERERACDDAVIRRGIRASEYGQCLLAHAQSITAWGASPVATVMFGHSAGLGARVVALLDPKIDRSAGSRPKIAVVGGMLGLIFAVSAAAPRSVQQRSIVKPTSLVSAAMVPAVTVATTSDRPSHAKSDVTSATLCRQATNPRNARTYSDNSVRITGAGATFNDGISRQIWTGLDCVAWIQYSGTVNASIDERSITVGDGGNFIAYTDGPDGKREYKVSPQSTSMTLNGGNVSIGAPEQAWIAGMTREYLRRSGLRARERALAALNGGVEGLLAEVATLPRTGLRVEYLREGFAKTRDASSVVNFIHAGAALLDSMDATGAFLVSVPREYADNAQVLAAIYQEASSIEPDDAVEKVLKTFEPPRPLSSTLAPLVSKMIASLSSDDRRAILRAYYMNVRP